MRLHSERRDNSELFWTGLFVGALIVLGFINPVCLAGALVILSGCAAFVLFVWEWRYPLWIYFIPGTWLLLLINKLNNLIWKGITNFNDWLNNR